MDACLCRSVRPPLRVAICALVPSNLQSAPISFLLWHVKYGLQVQYRYLYDTVSLSNLDNYTKTHYVCSLQISQVQVPIYTCALVPLAIYSARKRKNNFIDCNKYQVSESYYPRIYQKVNQSRTLTGFYHRRVVIVSSHHHRFRGSSSLRSRDEPKNYYKQSNSSTRDCQINWSEASQHRDVVWTRPWSLVRDFYWPREIGRLDTVICGSWWHKDGPGSGSDGPTRLE